jgi:hypothetical protein
MGLQEKLLNTNSAVYVIVLIWWIGCLWVDERGTTAGRPIEETADSEQPTVNEVGEA